MKHPISTFAVLTLMSTASATAWAACSTNVVAALDVVTTVTITAGEGDVCEWRDSNPNDDQALTLNGVAVPTLTSRLGSVFESGATITDNGGRSFQTLRCSNNLHCGDVAYAPIPTSPSRPTERYCQVVNIDSLTATAVCTFD